jgi:hypothetical protein
MKCQSNLDITFGKVNVIFFSELMIRLLLMLKTLVLLCQLLKLSEKDIVEMVFFPVINEACRVLDEGIAVKASDLDIASVFGMGFPPYRSAFENPDPICLFQLNDGSFVII